MIETLTPSATLVERAYQALLDAICSGALAAGERLTQDGLALRLQVSRQPVVQALALLKSQGFVQDTGKRGVVVAHLDPAFFKAIYELRSAIDPMAARLATARVTPQTEREGREILREGQRALRAGELAGLIRADVRFHTFIYELSGNPLFPDLMKLYWNHLRRAMGEVLRTKGEGRIVWREHQEILDAIVAGDAEKAARLAQAHLESAVERVLLSVETKAKPRAKAAS